VSFTETKEKIKTDSTHFTAKPEQKMETDLIDSRKNENRIREEKRVQQRIGTTQIKCKTQFFIEIQTRSIQPRRSPPSLPHLIIRNGNKFLAHYL
jgi:hypothetical protein